jgi:hypothetical protein
MNDYRAYFLDNNGHVAGSKVFKFPTDDEAIEEVKQLFDGRAVELWAGARKVAQLPARSPE